MVFYVMLLNLLDTVAKRSCWIFDLHVKEGDRLIVHLPLVYRSPVYAELEAYARAAQYFVDTAVVEGMQGLRIIDDCAFSFPAESYAKFKLRLATELLHPAGPSAALVRQSIQLRKCFSACCLQLERLWIQQQPLHEQFALAYSQLVKLIAINLANPFYEAYYLFLHHHKSNDALFQSLKQKYLLPPAFSHLKWYSDKALQLKNDASFAAMNDYFWTASFLKEHTRGNAVNILNDDALQAYTLADFTENYPGHKEIIYDDTGITDVVPEQLPETEHVFFMLRLLQVNEEYRHYWQARFMRWVKLSFTPAQTANCNFTTLHKLTCQYEPATP